MNTYLLSHNQIKSFKTLFLGTLPLLILGAFASPSHAQQMAPITLAQAGAPTPNVIPTDATPFTLTPERDFVEPGLQFRINQKLPEKLWYTMTVEASQRLDTNVLFTSKQAAQADYAFRVLPNVSVGYNVLKNTSVYGNYFVIKDVFATHGFLSKPTTQSVSLGFRQDIPIGRKTNVQLDFQARELWQVKGLRQSDLLPSVSILYRATPKTIIFGSTLLQLRGGDYFTGGQREIDPFFSAGIVHLRNDWTFSLTDTYVSNWRNRATAIPNQSNQSMIMDIEAARLISKKIPGLQVFFRAEPIWNWNGNNLPGLSGFDFRLFSGIRFTAAKPSYGATIARTKEQILQQEQLNKAPVTPSNPNSGNNSISKNSDPAQNIPESNAQDATPETSQEPAQSVPQATAQQAIFNPASL